LVAKTAMTKRIFRKFMPLIIAGVSLLVMIPAVSAYESHSANVKAHVYQPQTISESRSLPDLVAVNSYQEWTISFNATNPYGYAMQNTVVSDQFVSELQIRRVAVGGSAWDFEYRNYPDINAEYRFSSGLIWSNWYPLSESFPPNGVGSPFALHWAGNSHDAYLEWTVGNLSSNRAASLSAVVYTDKNQAGTQEFASSGAKDLDLGATMKWRNDDNKQLSSVRPPVTVTVGY
jgi:hypothetical protein